MDLKFTRDIVGTSTSTTARITSSAQVLENCCHIEEQLHNAITEINSKVDLFVHNGSQWQIENVTSIHLTSLLQLLL